VSTLEFDVVTSLNADAIEGVVDTLRLNKVWVQTLFEKVK